MPASSGILDYYARTNTPFLHAKGRRATDVLVEHLDGRPGEKTLEIGFGTGATLVRMVSKYPESTFYGVEASALMYKKATARLRFCGLIRKTDLRLALGPALFPFETATFDKVYAESVLGIQEGEGLAAMVAEICRVLKPGGQLFLNETVWLDEVPMADIRRLNDLCRDRFGIIQANGDYAYPAQWKSLLENYGLAVRHMGSLEDAQTSGAASFPEVGQILSGIYTGFGRMNRLFSPALRQEKARYRQGAEGLFQNRKYMEGLFLIADKL